MTHDTFDIFSQEMIFGGIEITSTPTEWLFTELLRNPMVMMKVQEEIRRVVTEKATVDADPYESRFVGGAGRVYTREVLEQSS